ncbi:hypothetical protein [Mucilaginibacter jinjuensis]|uniref:Uncharacterized protein n=1 Tax=Mucilaginibacter jinjuensis TaxID=1176721 RepID=A0ABY7T6Q0_9SPHI|nr:hypothetical protein [Mucilaginibacter jinjuensis]WCT12061.1 hypothetical protein PQO05_25345 [Mucilaginibacter jinjuensis]
MDENRIAILNDSGRLISKLQLLSVFFEEEIIYKIYLRSQVIHQLFANNPEIDINKLELFHLQFTTSLIDLLKKIKKNNEKSISLLLDEIELNKNLVEQIHSSAYTMQDYKIEQQRQALKINTSLRNLYKVLSDDTADYPFSKNINLFSTRFSHDFYYEVSPAMINDIVKYDAAAVYSNAYAIIQKKLMGVLCKYDFRTSFYCGIRADEQIAEIYKFNEEDRYFLYYPLKNLFLFMDISLLNNMELTTELSKKESFVQEIIDKNNQLQNTISSVKKTIPSEIKSLLVDNYKKLNDINFLTSISDIDVQANILKSMLNTDII